MSKLGGSKIENVVLASVQETIVGRDREIRGLLALIGQGDCPAPNLLVYGRPESGKTTVVRSIVSALGRRFAWLTCVSSQPQGHILKTIFSQLKGTKRTVENGYKAESGPSNATDFLRRLPGVCPCNQPTALIVIDNAHNLAGNPILSILLRAREISNANVSVILISQLSWASGAFQKATLPVPAPIPFYFRSYTEVELLEILAKADGVGSMNEGAKKAFLSGVVGPLLRGTCSIRLLQRVVRFLGGKYWEPVVHGEASPDDHAKLNMLVRPHMSKVIECLDGGIEDIGHRASGEPLSNDYANSVETLHERTGLDKTGLPYCSKLLLLAAYICSRNKSELDRVHFDKTYSRKKRAGTRALEREEEAHHAALMEGPLSFDVERLLAVFRFLFRGSMGDDSESQAVCNEDNLIVYSSKVMTQLQSLVSLKLLSQVSGDLLEGCKYKCNVPDGLANKIADNLAVNLNNFTI